MISPTMNNDAQKEVEQESTEGRNLTDTELETILSETEDSLVIPDSKPKHQILLCPVGLVGAGKTTVVEPLSQRLNLVRISTDEVRKRLKEKGYNLVRTIEIGKKLIERYLQKGYNVAIDADCSGQYELVSALTTNTPITPVWIHINPPESFILNKLKTFKHSWLFKDAGEAIANYHRRKPLHENLDMPFVYTFDTSREDLSQQIEEAVEQIRQIK